MRTYNVAKGRCFINNVACNFRQLSGGGEGLRNCSKLINKLPRDSYMPYRF